MIERPPHSPLGAPAPAPPLSQLRYAAAVLGLIMVVFGVFGCIRLFFSGLAFVKDPTQYATIIAHWVDVLDFAEAAIMVEKVQMPLGQPTAILLLGFAVVVLVRLLTAIIKAGLQLLSWSTGELEAMRRLINQALGRPQKGTPDDATN